jgi:hypothetical protein
MEHLILQMQCILHRSKQEHAGRRSDPNLLEERKSPDERCK